MLFELFSRARKEGLMALERIPTIPSRVPFSPNIQRF